MPTYRARPVEVQAEQWFPDRQVTGVFRSDNDPSPGKCRYYVVTIHEQRAFLAAGDYVVTEPDGVHCYPCKKEIFEAKYDLVMPPASPPALMSIADDNPMGNYFRGCPD
jgi:hypothetical protein